MLLLQLDVQPPVISLLGSPLLVANCSSLLTPLLFTHRLIRKPPSFYSLYPARDNMMLFRPLYLWELLSCLCHTCPNIIRYMSHVPVTWRAGRFSSEIASAPRLQMCGLKTISTTQCNGLCCLECIIAIMAHFKQIF